MREPGHAPGQVGRVADALFALGQEVAEEFFEPRGAVREHDEPASGIQTSDLNLQPQFALEVVPELQVVGENQVGEVGKVARELVVFLDPIQRNADGVDTVGLLARAIQPCRDGLFQ